MLALFLSILAKQKHYSSILGAFFLKKFNFFRENKNNIFFFSETGEKSDIR